METVDFELMHQEIREMYNMIRLVLMNQWAILEALLQTKTAKQSLERQLAETKDHFV